MENSSTIILEPIVDLSNIENLHKACISALDDNSNTVTIDASQVERLKTPAFQLLISFKNTCKDVGKTVIISSPSDGFKNLSMCLGAWELFNDK